MSFVEHILNSKLEEAREVIFARLDELVAQKLEEAKPFIVDAMFEEVEYEDLDEDIKRNPNVVKMGRIQKIRRRIRRNTRGRIIVQRNVRRSGLKGYKMAGNTVRRIPATIRLSKARKLKRSWKTTRRAKLRRTLIKRKISMRRRTSIGLK
jgi:hypothetical protein